MNCHWDSEDTPQWLCLSKPPSLHIKDLAYDTSPRLHGMGGEGSNMCIKVYRSISQGFQERRTHLLPFFFLLSLLAEQVSLRVTLSSSHSHSVPISISKPIPQVSLEQGPAAAYKAPVRPAHSFEHGTDRATPRAFQGRL